MWSTLPTSEKLRVSHNSVALSAWDLRSYVSFWQKGNKLTAGDPKDGQAGQGGPVPEAVGDNGCPSASGC